MIHRASRFVRYASVAGISAVALMGGMQTLGAAQATANIGATVVDNGGGVGTPVTPPTTTTTTTTTSSAATASTPTSVSNGTLVVTPTTATSNLGFSPPAPVAPPPEAAPAGVVSDSSNELPRASRPFSRASSSNISIGARTSVGVSGGPNQTYSVILPSQTIYSNAGNIISLNDFQHNAGSTPSLDGQGGDIFSIGASVLTVPIGEQSFISTEPETETGQAVTGNGTTAEANPIPSIQNIIAGTDGLSTNANQRQQILAAAFTARSPFVNIVVSYN